MKISAANHQGKPSRVPSFDVEAVRRDFPALHQRVYGKPLMYLDNAATSQKPQAVIDAISRFYGADNSNVHRGVHTLSQRATESFEGVRDKVRQFINASDRREVIFTAGTTAAINLVSNTFGLQQVGAGDEVLVSGLEHHSNIVPWQLLCERQGARLAVVPLRDSGEISVDDVAEAITARTRLIAIAHVSNALGTINPVKEIVELARSRGVPVLLDGAQAAPHIPIDVLDLGVDFYCLSSHKMFGPTGVGVLYGRQEILETLPPYQGGGDMISSVTFEKSTFNELPYRFEAGTPNIAGVVGMGAAIDYIQGLGHDRIASYEDGLLRYATERLAGVSGLRIIGTAPQKVAVVSFVLDAVHPHDVGTILDREGIAVRTGHHCAQPIMDRFRVPATVRASLAFYNTTNEVDALVRSLDSVLEVFGNV